MNVPTHYPKKDVLLIAAFALAIGLALSLIHI